MRKIKLGIIVGRFQVPVLHNGHRYLIHHVLQQNESVAIFIGKSPLGVSYANPLPAESIKHGILHEVIGVAEEDIRFIVDCKSDITWSKNLDEEINKLYPAERYDVCLYGSRDSFLKCYSGTHRREIVDQIDHVPATHIRTGIGKFIKDSVQFREGIVYATQNTFPVSYQCVDMAVTNTINNSLHVLMGKKAGEAQWRFPGGFVDPTDESLELAAKRELAEECGDFQVSDPVYIKSVRIDDWRYKKEKSKILTAFFHLEYKGGTPVAGDDLIQAEWINITDIEYINVADNHIVLMDTLKLYLKNHQYAI